MEMTVATKPRVVRSVPTRGRGWLRWGIGLGAAVLAMGMYLWFSGGEDETVPAAGTFYRVVPMDLDVKIIKDGELQATNNIDIINQVEGLTTIQQLVKEGSTVKKGDVLVVMDSANIREAIEDQTLALQRSQADLTAAKEMKDIQESQNATNIDAAEVALALAKLDLQQYVEGAYPQQLANSQTALDMANITQKNKEEDLMQTRRLFEKGFVTAADVKKGELELTVARNEVEKAQTALLLLTKYTHEMDLTSKKNALVQAERRMQRTQSENASLLSQRLADVQAKTQVAVVIKRKAEHLQEQLEACTIHAPADGLVVYASSGDRFSNSQILEGNQVRERQMLLRLPDTSEMKVSVRIQEAQIPKLRIGQRALVKLTDGRQLLASLTRISVLSDSSQRWWNPDLKEYPVDLTLDQTPPNLKPGLSVTAEVYLNRLDQVLALPLTAVYTIGQDAYAFVRDGQQRRPVKVTLGEASETHLQILDGIKAGQEVLVLQVGQGRELLEKAGIKVDQPTSRPSLENRKAKKARK